MQGHPELEASLGYIRCCSKKILKEAKIKQQKMGEERF